jgi:sarcosine oxidase subunit gamma
VCNGAPFDSPGHFGAAATGVTIAATTIAIAWNVQGRPDNAEFVDEARRAFGIELPLEPNTTTRNDALTALWIGPRSWLLVSGAVELGDFGSMRDTINAAGGALFDVSCARATWAIAGAHATTVLASGCPLDFHPRAFRAGTCAQSRYGHVNVLIEKRDGVPTFVLMAPRSYARDVEHALATVAAQYGCDVLAPPPYG